MGFGSGGSGTSSIAGASDTTLNNPTNNEVLTYDGATSMWSNLPVSGGGSGNVYVTTTGATLPGDLADGTVIVRYAASGPATPVVTSLGNATRTTSGTSTTITTSASIPAGDVLVVALTNAVQSINTAGSATFSVSTGSVGSITRASAVRALTLDTALLSAMVTGTIPAGSTITVTTSGNNQSRAAALALGVHNLSSATPNASSGDVAAGVAGDQNAGPGANATTLTASTAAATNVANTLVIGAFGGTTNASWSFPGGITTAGQVFTAAGTTDRGVSVGYRIASTAAVQTMTINGSGSAASTGTVMAFPITLVEN